MTSSTECINLTGLNHTIRFLENGKPLNGGEKTVTGLFNMMGKGHMSVHLYPGDYKTFDTNKNIDSIDHETLKELARFYQSNFVYFADYKILNDSTIEHHRISATEPKNFETLTRNFEFRGDTLILTAIEKIEGKKMRLRWVKL